MGAVLGAFTEYASIVGGKMLFEHQDFFEANSNLGWTDALDITIASGFGAASGAIDGGIVNFSKWIAKPTNQKIVAMMLEVGVSSLESSLKQIYKDEEFDLTSILAGALADVGVGNLLKTDIVKKEADITKKNANASTKKAEDLAKRKNPNQKQIKKTKNEATKHKNQAKALNKLNNTGIAIKDTEKKIVGNKTQAVVHDLLKDKKINLNLKSNCK